MNEGLQVTAHENMHNKCKHYLLTDSFRESRVERSSHITEENIFDIAVIFRVFSFFSQVHPSET